MLKRTLCLAMCLFMSFSLCGCSEDAVVRVNVDFDLNMDKIHKGVSDIIAMEESLAGDAELSAIEKEVFEKLGIEVEPGDILDGKKKLYYSVEEILGVLDKYYGE